MQRNGWILLLVLIFVAFLVSHGKKTATDQEKGDLVRIETGGKTPSVFCKVT